jgi:hypothetical protein
LIQLAGQVSGERRFGTVASFYKVFTGGGKSVFRIAVFNSAAEQLAEKPIAGAPHLRR